MKKSNSIFAIFIIVLLTISTFAMLSKTSLFSETTVNAQTASTVPSNMQQYEWLLYQGGQNTHFSAGPGPSSPDVLWQKNVATTTGNNPVAFDGMLFITQGQNITAIDPETGNIIYNIVVPPVLTGRTCTTTYIIKVSSTVMIACSGTAAVINTNVTKDLPAASALRGFNIADGSLLWSQAPQYGPTTAGFITYIAAQQMVY